ncbi:MAG: hypothetical protein HDT35_03065 [Clostridiales bacterium]|nr:hypothetical protein [Clostridiales bacterium]
MTDSALSLLGLALRGSNLAVGEEPVQDACKTQRARLVMSAADAAQNSIDRAGRMAETGGVPWIRLPWDKETLGGALGRKLCAVAALTDQGLASALAEKLIQTDESLRPALEPLLTEKKKPRAVKGPAPRES